MKLDRRSPAEAPRALLLAALAALAVLAGCQGGPAAVTVESVAAGGPGELYGFVPGDRLLAWRQGEDAGAIESPLDLLWLEIERAPRGDLELEVLRRGRRLWLQPAGGRWDIALVAPAAGGWGAENFAESPQERTSESGVQDSAGWHLAHTAAGHAAAGELERAASLFETLREGEPDPRRRDALATFEGRAWLAADEGERAAAAFEAALAGRRQRLPDSLAVAVSLVDLATALPASARRPPFEEAAALFAAWAPDGPDAGDLHHRLGIHTAIVERRFEAAIEHYEQALERRRRHLPDGRDVGRTLANLAQCHRRFGRLDQAQESIEAALDTLPEALPRLEDEVLLRDGAGFENTLALILRDKGDLRGARLAWERSLEGFRRLTPESAAVAGVLHNLGGLSRRSGDLALARQRYGESLTLRRRLDPSGRSVAASLNSLALVASDQGHLAEAEVWLRESLEIKRRLAAGSMSLASTLVNLGDLHLRRAEVAAARPYIAEARELMGRLAAGSPMQLEIEILWSQYLSASERRGEAISTWSAALEGLDELRQGLRFSAQERSVFASQYQRHYRDLAELLLSEGRILEAFAWLERSRARALRSLVVGASSPAELPAWEWSRVQAALPEGTRLVIYSVGEDSGVVMIGAGEPTGAAGLSVHSLGVGRDELAGRVERFRALIARGQGSPRPEPALENQARQLFQQLLGPLADELPAIEHLVIVPDRALTAMPFAALLPPGEGAPFLGHTTRLSYAASGTWFASRRHGVRPAAGGPRVTVVAYGAGSRSGSLRGRTFDALPGVRREARTIGRLFPQGGRVLLDGAAREADLLAEWQTAGASSTPEPANPGPREAAEIVHFAGHALVDPRDPLRSALVLAGGGGADGLLEAQEVIDHLQRPADLVTLSACDTGLGRDLGSEAMLGLSHAFLFRGAGAVVTSLWKVDDQATAEWMQAFYGAIAGGAAVNQALLAAQRSAAQGHPYRWAAFQLWGDGEAALSLPAERRGGDPPGPAATRD